MIVKHFEYRNLDTSNYNYYLFYGKNEGFQNEIIEKYFTNGFLGEIIKYEENEIVKNSELVIGELLNNSLFNNDKILIIDRASDKIRNTIDELLLKNLKDIKIILKAGLLEKRSKLRNLFEKDKNLVITPFYEDDAKNLFSIVVQYLNKHKIKLGRESINLLVERARGERKNLNIELEKIYNYSISNKEITLETIQKLTNLAENYEVSELANQFLCKNKKNVFKILNENNYSEEDCVLILRTILFKSKRLLGIIEQNNNINDIDKVIMNVKPPIFWKDKENVKKQVNEWKINDLKEKIYKISEIESIIKNNSKNSLNIVSDFIVNY